MSPDATFFVDATIPLWYSLLRKDGEYIVTQGERVNKIRKTLNLTLEKFGERVGVRKTSISKIEKGEVGLSGQMTKSICREFNVNYDWLVYGDGEMFSNLPRTILDDLCLAYGCDEFDRNFVENYMESAPEVRAAIKKCLLNLFEKNNAES